jgi:two-component sensor histidine kinase
VLAVSDNGRGFPPGFDPENSPGLGMKVVRMVARQLGGTLTFDRCDRLGGARVRIIFPEPLDEAKS